MTHLKVLSYNIHKGFGPGYRRFVLRRLKESIERVHADLVFLQEVVGSHSRHASRFKDWPTTSQFEYLADRLWPHTAYGKNAVYTAGHHGNAILSKYPILEWDNLNISTNLLESRGLLHAVIKVPKRVKPLHAVCLHLGLFEASRRTQLRWLCERIESTVGPREPLLIGGDFNDWRVRSTSLLEDRLGLDEVFFHLTGEHARTFPSWLPALRLDRIYYRSLAPAEAKVLSDGLWSKLSDHAALYAEFLFPARRAKLW